MATKDERKLGNTFDNFTTTLKIMKPLKIILYLTGIHYHFNISKDFDCNKALPVFLLFSEQSKTLIGFGWGGPFDVPSAEWEKPPPSLFAVSIEYIFYNKPGNEIMNI